MIRLMILVRKREDVELERFRTFWKGRHAEMVRDLCGALDAFQFSQSMTLNIERNRTMHSRYGTETPFDGSVEIFWDQAGHLEIALGDPEIVGMFGRFMVEQRNFIDHSRSCMYFTEPPFELSTENILGRKEDF